jgi:hypothetical protein
MYAVIQCRISSFLSLLTENIKFTIYRIIILPDVVYGHEPWLLRLGEECRLRVFVNRVLRGIFGAKRDKVTGEWRKLHIEELNDYTSPNIIRGINSRRICWVERVARMG